MRKWWGSLVDSAARAMGVPSAPAAMETVTKTSSAKASKKKLARKAGKKAKPSVGAAEICAFAEQGLSRAEIARRTGLSQDMVGMLLHLSPERPAESAASGTFFRILEARMAS